MMTHSAFAILDIKSLGSGTVRYVFVWYGIGWDLMVNNYLGLPKAFKRLNPKEYEIVENEPDEVVFKLRLVGLSLLPLTDNAIDT